MKMVPSLDIFIVFSFILARVRSQQFTNLALNQLAEQQDEYPGGSASNAVDGNTNGNWEAGSMAHTFSTNAWWRVTLKETSYIANIDIYNRMDCCQGRLRNARVSLDGTLIGTIPQVDGTQKYTLSVDRRGQVVEIQGVSGDTLQLAEVEVYGASSSPTSSEDKSITSLRLRRRYNLPGGLLKEGSTLVFTGIIQDVESRFLVNFYTAGGDIALHFNPRPAEEVIVLNSAKVISDDWESGLLWAEEVRIPWFWLSPGDEFRLVITVENDKFTIKFNDNKYEKGINHREAFVYIASFEVDGPDKTWSTFTRNDPEEGCLEPGDTDGSKYRGSVAQTRGGLKCQRWDAQQPQGHSRTAENYPDSGLERNYCRNPDNEDAPWCYNGQSSEPRWDYCDIAKCEVDVGCWPAEDQAAKGSAYRGTQNVTVDDVPCINWKDSSYFTEEYFDKGIGDHNYCRNPEEKYDKVWCYKSLGWYHKWDYCSVPTCPPEPVITPSQQPTTTQDTASPSEKWIPERSPDFTPPSEQPLPQESWIPEQSPEYTPPSEQTPWLKGEDELEGIDALLEDERQVDYCDAVCTLKGETGESGLPGDRGVEGEVGQDGDTGGPGDDADDGEPGSPGSLGMPGMDGDDGPPGAEGDPGQDGEQNCDGTKCPGSDVGLGRCYAVSSWRLSVKCKEGFAAKSVWKNTRFWGLRCCEIRRNLARSIQQSVP